MSIPFGFSPNNGDENELASMFENMGRMMRSGNASSTSSVDWIAARESARTALRQSGDPIPAPESVDAIQQSYDLADLWLNDATTFPSTSISPLAMTRTAWVDATFDRWKEIVEPVADGVSRAMTSMMPSPEEAGSIHIPDEVLSQLPDDVAAQMRDMLQSPDFANMVAPLMAMAKSMGATMFGSQFGEALGQMANEVLCSSDVGFPLTNSTQPGFVVENVATFASGLSMDVSDVRLYIALRELAHQRLFAHAPWLGSQVLAAISEYSRGVQVDTARIEEALAGIDPNNIEELQTTLGADIFESARTPEQTAALERLEVLLALIEGWVTSIVTLAASSRLPNASALEEVFRRRRAAGGPAEKLFSSLIGLEIRPRRMREASALWERITTERGAEARDSLWSHPDLLPRAEDIENIDSFFATDELDIMAELSKAMESGTPAPVEDEPGNSPE